MAAAVEGSGEDGSERRALGETVEEIEASALRAEARGKRAGDGRRVELKLAGAAMVAMVLLLLCAREKRGRGNESERNEAGTTSR